jgi:uncharacterized membrane protein
MALFGWLSRRPFHPPLTHFPIALLSTSLLWDVLSHSSHARMWQPMAYWTLIVGLLAGVAAVTLGMVDATRYVWIEERSLSRATQRMAIVHIALVMSGLIVFGASLYVRHSTGIATGSTGTLPLILSASGTVLILGGAALGGELVYAKGVGRATDEPSALSVNARRQGSEPARASQAGH